MDNSRAYLYGAIIGIVTLCCTIILALEIPRFHYLLNPSKFMVIMIAASIIIGVLASYFLSRGMNNVDKLRTYLILVFFSFIPVLGIGSWLNRQCDDWTTETVEILAFDGQIGTGFGILETDPKEANQFIVTFKRNNRLHRKMISENPGYDFDEFPQNISIKVNRGLLGFEFVRFL